MEIGMVMEVERKWKSHLGIVPVASIRIVQLVQESFASCCSERKSWSKDMLINLSIEMERITLLKPMTAALNYDSQVFAVRFCHVVQCEMEKS